MRTPTLQYLYLQKPVTMIIIICFISVLPWLGLNELSTPAASSDALIADAMLRSGEWVLPPMPSGGINYDHPMLHWLICLCSFPQGYVSKLTLQLPGAIAFIVMMASTLIFFGRRIKFHEAFITTLFLITSSGMQNLSAASSGDLLFATFIFVALTQLYRWNEEWELKGIPVEIALLLSGAILTKGLMGLILPIAAFTIFLFLTRRYSAKTITKAMCYVSVSSLFLPIVWYATVWKQGGIGTLGDVLRNEFTTFWSYSGDGHTIFYIIPLLAIGFLPWIFFFLFSLFGVKNDIHKQRLGLERTGVKFFSFVTWVVLLAAYAIMPVKKASFLLPAYPFFTIFLAQYALHITEYRTLCTRIFAGFMSVAVLGSLLLMMFPTEWSPIPPVVFSRRIVLLMIFTWCMLLTVIYQMCKKINIKILYATIALAYAVNMLVNANELLG